MPHCSCSAPPGTEVRSDRSTTDIDSCVFRIRQTIPDTALSSAFFNLTSEAPSTAVSTLLSGPGGENSIVWQYNYTQHLSIFHRTYACPGTTLLSGQRLLPYLVWKDAELTVAEQKKALIQEENMFPLFTAHEPPTTEAAVTGNKRASP
jgi:hypothetical protein